MYDVGGMAMPFIVWSTIIFRTPHMLYSKRLKPFIHLNSRTYKRKEMRGSL